MTSRLLPREEWKRLTGTELETILPFLDADQDAHVIVVEENDAVVGCWALVRIWHAEGLWIAANHRGKGSVARHLLRMLRRVGAALGVPGVMTASVSDDVTHMLKTYAAHQVPGTHWLMPLERTRVCLPQ